MAAPFIKQKTALLTTYRRSGEPVGTPVNVAVEGDHIFFRTWDTTGKFKRLRNNTMVELVPSTFRKTDRSADSCPRAHPFRYGIGARREAPWTQISDLARVPDPTIAPPAGQHHGAR